VRNKLKALSLKNAPKGSYQDGDGLFLKKRNQHQGRWVFRFQKNKKRRDMGLGSFPTVSLALARERAEKARVEVALGQDPIASQETTMTFEEAAKKYIDTRVEPRVTSKQVLSQWRSSLRNHAFPEIGMTSVADVTSSQIIRILKPLWETKPVAARKLHSRLRNVFSWAIASKLRLAANPVEGVAEVLPHQSHKTTHLDALPWQEAPAFWSRLLLLDTPASRALRFLILTACRSNEARDATWDEINLDKRVWIIPATRMKNRHEHRVPLSAPSLEMLATSYTLGSNYCFPSAQNKKLSENAFRPPLQKLEVGVTAHGFRSTFRDWAAENTSQPKAIIEACLAHGNPDKVEAAYLRTDFFEKRRQIMADWASYLQKLISPC